MLSCRKIRRRRREQHMPPLRLNAGRHSLASKKNRRFRPPVEADGPSVVSSGRRVSRQTVIETAPNDARDIVRAARRRCWTRINLGSAAAA